LWSLWASGSLPRLTPRPGETHEAYFKRCLTPLLPCGGPEGLILEAQEDENPYSPVRIYDVGQTQDRSLLLGLRVLEGHQINAARWYSHAQQRAPGLAPALLWRLQRALRVPSWSGFEAFDHFSETLWQGYGSEEELFNAAHRELGEQVSDEEVLEHLTDEYGEFYTLADLKARLGAEFCRRDPLPLEGDLATHCSPYSDLRELLNCVLALEELEALEPPELSSDHSGLASGWLFLTLEAQGEPENALGDWILESYEEYHSYYMESGEHPDTHTLKLEGESLLALLARLRVEAQLMARVRTILEWEN